LQRWEGRGAADARLRPVIEAKDTEVVVLREQLEVMRAEVVPHEPRRCAGCGEDRTLGQATYPATPASTQTGTPTWGNRPPTRCGCIWGPALLA